MVVVEASTYKFISAYEFDSMMESDDNFDERDIADEDYIIEQLDKYNSDEYWTVFYINGYILVTKLEIE